MQVVQAVTSRSGTSKTPLCIFFDADAREVVTAARDGIHNGWRLLHHPLYGNYRPYQQPYRSLILASPAVKTTGLDLDSLHLIEEALVVYTENRTLAPSEAPASLLDACGLLDYELMRLPLEQAGVIPDGYTPAARSERGEELSRNCA